MSRSREPVPWRHAVVSTPLFTAATVYTGSLALGVVEDLGGTMPVGLMQLGSVTGVLAASASRWLRTHGTPKVQRWFHTGFTATWTAATYGWLTWTATMTPWTFAAATTCAIGAAAFTPLYAVDRWMRRDAIAAQWAADAAARLGGEAAEWERVFHEAGARGVEVGKPEATRGGQAFPLTLGQHTFEMLLPLVPTIEVRKGGLRSGSVRLMRAESGMASEAVLHVSERNVLAETIPLPPDVHPLTIREPITLGDLESGEPLEITFRQNCVLIAGKKGSGKSVLLHVIIAAITRCTDAVIWMIDLAEGNVAKRWLRPWAEEWKDHRGRAVDRPILDWVATTQEESVRLLQAALAVADGRAGRMKGGKIKPSKKTPALVVISDENADLMAWNATAKEYKTRGVKKGRKAAVDYIDAVQRGTGPNTGGGEIDSQYDTTIGMRFPKKAEGQFVFPGRYHEVDLSKLPGNGSLIILDEARSLGVGPERAKAHFANDDDEDEQGNQRDDIEQLAVARWDIRPDLDEASQKDAAPYGYADRWSQERTGWLDVALGIKTDATQHAEPKPNPTMTMPGSAIGDLPSIDSYIAKYRDWKPGDPRPQQPSQETGAPPRREAGTQPDPTPEPERSVDPATAAAMAAAVEEAERIAAAAAIPEPQAKSRRHPRRDEVTSWVRDAGDDGISVAEVRNRLLSMYPRETPPSDTALQNWFTEHPNIEKPSRGRYVWRTQAQAAHSTGLPAGIAPADVLTAAELVVSTQFGSGVMLQRKLRIGGAAADGLLDILHAAGIVGPPNGDRAREVRVRPSEIDAALAALAQELGLPGTTGDDPS